MGVGHAACNDARECFSGVSYAGCDGAAAVKHVQPLLAVRCLPHNIGPGARVR